MRADPDAPPEDFTGTARYQIVRRLGGGGMGVVYEALDRERGARVALKTMRLGGPKELLRFKNEFRALAELDHPNVAQLGELHEDAGRWFFTMELVEGTDFLSWVRPRGAAVAPASTATTQALAPDAGPRTADLRAPVRPPRARAPVDPTPRFDEARLRAAFSQLSEGLAALHRAGQVHRDIKPQNVIVTAAGRVVIVDFGLVKGIDGQRTASSVAGTIAYMAPEQAAGLPVGPPADWWSAGVVLYEALTGRLPYADPTVDLFAARDPKPPEPPRALVPSAPPDLDELATELLSHSPELRPRWREILRRLRVEALEPRGLELERPPFVGRERELDALAALYQRAAGRSTCAVIIEGEPGVGKSALGRRFADELNAREPRPLVLVGRCHERESVPFKAIDGVVDALSRELARLPQAEAAAVLPRQASLLAQVFPVLYRVEAVAQSPAPRAHIPDPHERRLRVFAALKELLARLGDRRPLVVIVDDLHWADADSLALLAELLRAPDAPALLLVATLRSGEGLPPVRELQARLPCAVETLRLESLPRDATLKLIDAIAASGARRLDAQARAAICDESHGHPLFVGELVRRSSDGGPRRLEDALWAQIARLDAAPRRLLEVVAVASAPLPAQVIARAADCPLAELQPVTNSLRAAHFISTGGARAADAVEPFHDRVTAAVLAHLDEAQLAAHHERLARALEDSGRADPETLGRHWLGAGQRPRAATLFRQAAQEAAEALAFERAVRLYRRAFELAPPGGADWTRLGEALHNIGRGVEAARAYLEAAALASGLDALDLRRRAAEHLLRGGHVDEGLALLGEVLAAVGVPLPSSPRVALWRLGLRRAQLRLRGLGYRVRDARELAPETLARIDVCGTAAVGTPVANLVYGAYFQARHVQYALAAGEPARLCKALATEAVNAAAAGVRGRLRAERLLLAADELAQRLASPTARAQAQMGAGIVAFLLGDWRRASDASERAVELYRDCEGVGWELGNAQVFALLSLVYLGEHAALERRLPEAARQAEERGDLHAMITLRTGQPALVWLGAGDPDRARREVAAARAARAGNPWITQRAYYDLFAEAHLELYAGDGAAAHARMSAGWPELERSFLLGLTQIRIVMLDLRARAALAAASGPADPLLGAVEKWARVIERERAPWAAALASLLHAGVAEKRGEPERAGARLDAAVRDFTAAEMKLHAACARLRRGGDHAAAARAWMSQQQIVDPDRVARMLAPV